jgi:hypothetical protein
VHPAGSPARTIPTHRCAVFGRRRDDADPGPRDAADAHGTPLSGIAVGWLRTLLQDEFGDAAGLAREPGAADAAESVPLDGLPDEDRLRVWRREWVQRWRRLHLPEMIAAFRDALDEATSPPDVHAAFSEHATSIVGAYVCLLFLPDEEGRLAPLALPGAVPTPEGLWIGGSAPIRPAVVLRPDITDGSALAGLIPLFEEASASALLVTPYLAGSAVLVERRESREFGALDGALLDLLVAEAGTAFRRMAVMDTLGAGPALGTSQRERLEAVLRHGRAGAVLGLEVAFVRIRVEELPQRTNTGRDAAIMRHCAGVIRRAAGGAVPVLPTGDRDFLLVMNGSVEAAQALLERIRMSFGEGARLDLSVEAPGAAPCAAR